ncbi:MAG TPA: replication initiator, partial [Kineosporiaceae bacterium]|nr:replication initiator [Kineosporiaceae bacterium]
MTVAAPVGNPVPGVPAFGAVAEALARAANPARYDRWEQLVAQTGYCAHPVRLSGRVSAVDRATGEAGPMYESAAEPDGVLLTACGNRRENVCPTCSATYRADTWQLVAAGLRGGKGVPATVTA